MEKTRFNRLNNRQKGLQWKIDEKLLIKFNLKILAKCHKWQKIHSKRNFTKKCNDNFTSKPGHKNEEPTCSSPNFSLLRGNHSDK
jgi:hypothetical protein